MNDSSRFTLRPSPSSGPRLALAASLVAAALVRAALLCPAAQAGADQRGTADPAQVLVTGDPPLTVGLARELVQAVAWLGGRPLSDPEMKEIIARAAVHWQSGDRQRIAAAVELARVPELLRKLAPAQRHAVRDQYLAELARAGGDGPARFVRELLPAGALPVSPPAPAPAPSRPAAPAAAPAAPAPREAAASERATRQALVGLWDDRDTGGIQLPIGATGTSRWLFRANGKFELTTAWRVRNGVLESQLFKEMSGRYVVRDGQPAVQIQRCRTRALSNVSAPEVARCDEASLPMELTLHFDGERLHVRGKQLSTVYATKREERSVLLKVK